MNSGLELSHAGFNLGNARRLAELSQEAYFPAEHFPPQPAGAEWQHAFVTGVEEDAHVLISRFDDCTVIAFRGTASIQNWIEDAEFFRRKLAGRAEVHDGFYRGADCILPGLIKFLLPDGADKSQMKPLVFTGHSLGGALAMLCALELSGKSFPVKLVVTFGQPRVGNDSFSRLYDWMLGSITWRVVNQNDIVPRLPGWLTGYRHAGGLAFLNVAGAILLDPSWINLAISDGLGLWKAWRTKTDVIISEHFMASYIANLGRADFTEGNEGNEGKEKGIDDAG